MCRYWFPKREWKIVNHWYSKQNILYCVLCIPGRAIIPSNALLTRFSFKWWPLLTNSYICNNNITKGLWTQLIKLWNVFRKIYHNFMKDRLINRIILIFENKIIEYVSSVLDTYKNNKISDIWWWRRKQFPTKIFQTEASNS